jgi:hypothetical protein
MGRVVAVGVALVELLHAVLSRKSPAAATRTVRFGREAIIARVCTHRTTSVERAES